MAKKKRAKLAPLAKLLDRASVPIYVLDADRRVAFCNDAALRWVGCEGDALLDRECRYAPIAGPAPRPRRDEEDLADEQLDRIAAGLCPPPEAWRGQEARALVTASDENGWLQRRIARFIPISLGDARSRPEEEDSGEYMVLAVVEPKDLEHMPHAAPFVLPPVDGDLLDDEAARLRGELQEYSDQRSSQYQVRHFVGNCEAMLLAQARIQLAAESCAHVSICGPSGSGRRHAARAIYYGRPEGATGALLPIDCAVLGVDVIESTLHALASRSRRTDGQGAATLLLQDIDCLAPDVQHELAASLADPHFTHRAIATSSEPLSRCCAQGRFCEKLAAMLAPIEICLPPLAARVGDVPLLAQFFVEQCNAVSDKQVGGFTSGAIDLLGAYSWPGNVAELLYVVETAFGRAEGARVCAEDLPERLHHASKAIERAGQGAESLRLDEYLADVELRLIQRALELSKGNRSKAAELLGVSRPRLYRRLEQLGLE